MLHSLLGYEILLSIICSEHHIQFTRCFKISTFPCGVRHIFCNGVRPRLVRLAYYSYVLSYCHFHDSSLLPCRKHFFFSACRPILNISLGKRENAYNACLHGPKPKFRRKGYIAVPSTLAPLLELSLWIISNPILQNKNL